MSYLLFFALLPLVEIAGFVIVGGWIGLWPTLGLVVLAAVLGVTVIRRQGAGLAFDLRGEMDRMRDPVSPMAHRAMKVLAGLLLILPGFVSDLIALALLVLPVRQAVIRALAARVSVAPGFSEPGDRGSVTVIDGEFFEVDPTAPPPRGGQSGWTRH